MLLGEQPENRQAIPTVPGEKAKDFKGTIGKLVALLLGTGGRIVAWASTIRSVGANSACRGERTAVGKGGGGGKVSTSSFDFVDNFTRSMARSSRSSAAAPS